MFWRCNPPSSTAGKIGKFSCPPSPPPGASSPHRAEAPAPAKASITIKIDAVDVRHDLFRCLRAPPAREAGHCRLRAGLGAERAPLDGLHLPRAPRRGDLPVQERHAAERLLPPCPSSELLRQR